MGVTLCVLCVVAIFPVVFVTASDIRSTSEAFRHEVDEGLERTASASAAAFDREIASGVTLHHATYRGVREATGLPANLVCSSRAVAADGTPLSADTKAMAEAYDEYFAAAAPAMKPGATCHDVHTAVSRGFLDRGYHLGHVTGHSIGMTMIEHPRVGEGMETVLRSGMVLSMHPHAIAADGKACLYMQDTWLVTADGGVPMASLPMEIYVR